MEGGAEVAEVTLTAGADGKSFSHVCKEYIAVQVGEVSSNHFTEGNTHTHTDPQCFCFCELHVKYMSNSQQVIKQIKGHRNGRI